MEISENMIFIFVSTRSLHSFSGSSTPMGGLQWEREHITIPLQEVGRILPGFSALMWGLGQFCSADFIVPYFACLYWLLDQELCVYGIWLVPITETLNGMLKWVFRVPRPGWVDSRVEMRAWSHEFSFPSSHAQIIWTLSYFFSSYSNNSNYTRFYILALLICTARVYEGVHYPRDVFIGACIGVGKAACYLTVLPELLALAGRISLYEQVAALAIASAAWLTLVISRYAVIKQQKDNFPVKKWCETAATFSRTKTGSGGRRGDDDDDKLKEKRKNLVISPIEAPFSSYLGMTGVMFGLSIGIPTRVFVPLSLPPLDAEWSQLISRFLLGNAILLSIYFGCRLIEKQVFVGQSSTMLSLARIMRVIRYASVPIVILLIAPLAFNHLQI